MEQVKNKLLNIGCIDNEYLQKYLDLILANSKTTKEKYKTNCHHILPRCYFKLLDLPVDNSKANLVNLSHKDHLLAHYYLYSCATGKFKLLNSISFKYIETKSQLPVEKILENLDVYQQLCSDVKEQNSKVRLGKSNPHTKEWNKKISEANKGKKLSDETKQKLSKINRGKKLTGQALYNVQHGDRTNLFAAFKTKEHREKCRQNALGNKNKLGWRAPEETKHLQSINNGKNRKVICIETNEIFYNINDCAKQTGLTRQYITHLLKTGQACNARILTKYSKELKQKIRYYNSKHFKILEVEICSESTLN